MSTDSLTLDAQFSHVDGGFLLDFQDPSLVDVQQINYVDQGRVARSTTNYNTIRPQWETRIDGNYYLPKKLGGDHSLKFGYRYRTTPIESISQVGGGATVRIRASGANEADITRDADFNVQRYDSDFFVSDTYKVSRLTANIGIRLDQYRDKALSATTPANRILPDLLPSINYPGAESGVRWNNWQPRLGLSYDIFGSGKTVAKASVSRYYGITMNTAGTLQPTGLTTLRYAWTDLNSDLTVQRNELDSRARIPDDAKLELRPTEPIVGDDAGNGRSKPREQSDVRSYGWRRSRADEQLRRRLQLHPPQVR